MSAENEKRGAWRVERHDHDDGSITYKIWQEGPVPEMIEFDDLTLDGYRRIGSFHELYDSKFAKKDAELICKAVNALAQHEAMRKALEGLCGQTERDLKSAHAEICKLQGLDPDRYSWPEWSPQANTLRWIEKLRADYLSTPAPVEALSPKEAGEDVVERAVEEIARWSEKQPFLTTLTPREIWNLAETLAAANLLRTPAQDSAVDGGAK